MSRSIWAGVSKISLQLAGCELLWAVLQHGPKPGDATIPPVPGSRIWKPLAYRHWKVLSSCQVPSQEIWCQDKNVPSSCRLRYKRGSFWRTSQYHIPWGTGDFSFFKQGVRIFGVCLVWAFFVVLRVYVCVHTLRPLLTCDFIRHVSKIVSFVSSSCELPSYLPHCFREREAENGYSRFSFLSNWKWEKS